MLRLDYPNIFFNQVYSFKILKQEKTMEITIFYYSGTGNSLWVARVLAELLGGAQLVSISDWMKEKKPINIQTMGVVFPVHMWGVPPPIIKFVSEIKALSPQYIFAIAVDAAQVANTLVQLKNIFKKNGMNLSCGYEIKLPSNYIPWGGAEPREKQEQKFDSAKTKLSGIISTIKNKEKRSVDKGYLWERGLFTLLYRLSYAQISKMDGKFRVDEKCNQCGICSRVCPAENIILVEGKPTWNHHCEQCLACIQWCPLKAIQYGKKTQAYERYHHPEIQLKDMLKINSGAWLENRQK
jgi:formate hydrogenlyase subunit 6/NADH:ubiquinone oxidoreductase subunit I